MLTERRIYTSGEAAELLGVRVGWLRIGERLGSLPLARRNHAGWRFYTSEDLDRLRRLGVGERKRRLESGDD
jgi:DNA-binding transcriptional MerR regulator